MELLKALMYSQDFTLKEAKEELKEMQNRIFEGEDPEEILREYYLEPDYIFDLLF